MSGLVDNIQASLLGLKMPRAMEMLDHTIQRLEKGEISAIEAIDSLLSEEFNCREDRRVGVALTTARLTPPKTLESFDFTFQPSLDRDRIMALAQLDFVTRAEVVHFLGRRARARAIWPRRSGLPRSKRGKASTGQPWPNWLRHLQRPNAKDAWSRSSASMPGHPC